MAVIEIQGTKFTFSILQLKLFSNGHFARTEIKIENEFIHYEDKTERFMRTDIERWIFGMFRLIAGAYGKDYHLSFEGCGFSVDLCPYRKNGLEATRTERRQNDCLMSVQMLFHSSKNKQLLGGVYSLLLHRKDIERFAVALQKEYHNAFAKTRPSKGKYLYVGVSPQGYQGCNYWYLDESKQVKAGDYVWVKMGRHQTEQVVYVDSVQYCNDNTALYDINQVKKVIKIATEEEIEEAKALWKK